MSVNVLVTDAREVMREGLKSMLAGSEVDVVAEAQNSVELMRLIPEHEVDVVLLDIALGKGNPGEGDGFDVLTQLKRQSPEMPVIMWSATSDRATVARARALRASGLLPHTVSGSEVVSALRRVEWEQRELKR